MTRRKHNAPMPAEDTLRLLGERAEEAVAVLVELMRDTQQKGELRMKAAESILDRVCGKASSGAVGASEEAAPVAVKFEGVLEEWSE